MLPAVWEELIHLTGREHGEMGEAADHIWENNMLRKVGEQIPFPAPCYFSFKCTSKNLLAVFLPFYKYAKRM